MKSPYQKRHSQSHKPKQLGQALVEFSLILPLLLFLLLGILDYGRILLVYSNASSSVRNAARQGTLVGTIDDFQMGPNTPRYMACATIDDFARDIFGANVNSVDILYFNTIDDAITPAERDAIEAALNALDPTVLATLDPADYDCADDTINGPRNANPDISEGAIRSGDLMVILLNAQIDFITPLLSSVFPSFEITFRAQRTLVESLVLRVEGDDLDGDGLLDSWEYLFFGCVLANTESTNDPVYLLPDRSLAMRVNQSWAYVDGAYTGPPANPNPQGPPMPGSPISSSFGPPSTDCARETLSLSLFADPPGPPNPAFYDYLDCDPPEPDDTQLENCIVVSLDLFSSTSDPDGDGCNNGCEEARGTCPINDLLGICSDATDSDLDGLPDAVEIMLGTNPNPPEGVDSDGDGLWDGQERCFIEDPSEPDGCATSPDGRPWTKTDPRLADSDGDGLDDGEEYLTHGTDPNISDTDLDGLNDEKEVNGFVIQLEIDGITFTTGTIFTNPRAGGGDTDGDGILDGAEVNGHPITNAIDGTITVITHPNDPDTDDDIASSLIPNNWLCDGTGTTGAASSCAGIADVNPTKTDTDGDGISDGVEQIEYNTLADNVNSDADVCGLDDGFEMLGDQAVVAGTNPDGDTNLNGDPLVNARDLDSDTHDTTLVGDGISDCDEVNIYGSNPYHVDSDGDGYNDDVEILPENWCLEIMRPDVFTTATPICGAGSGTDSDLDGFPDAWEQLYFGPSGANLTNPLDAAEQATWDDNDSCDLQCEFDRRTDPTDADSDNDGIRDGWETGSNPLIADTDGDGLIDGRESSDTCLDFDSLQDVNFAYSVDDCYATNPLLKDTDLDGLDDGDELIDMFVDINGVNTNVGTTDPTDPDTDNDSLLDGEEALSGVTVTTTINGVAVSQVIRSNPNSEDSDGDGLKDFLESKIYRTFANDSDTDNDLVPDGSTLGTIGEFQNNFDNLLSYYDTNPLEADTDNDGLTDRQEIDGFNVDITTYDAGGVQEGPTTTAIAGYDIANPFSTTNLSPRISDTDGDGISDGNEVNVGDVTNPTLANTDGDVDGVGNPIVDGADNCPIHDNSDQQDLDGNGIGSACEVETPTDIYVDPLTDASSLVDPSNWLPSVVVKAVNNFNQPQSGVTVQVTFKDGGGTTLATPTCVTIADGTCTVDIGARSQTTLPNVTATVSNVTTVPAGLTYTPASNDGPLAIDVPPLSVHVETITGSNSGTAGSWEAIAIVEVRDDFGATVDGVDVEVTFTDNDGLVSTEVCTTGGGNGQCQVSTGTASLDGTDPDATATITNITNLGSYGYDATSDAAPEVIAGPPYEAVTAGTTTRTDNGNSWTATLEVAVSNGTTLLNGRTVTFSYTTTTVAGSKSTNTANCSGTTGSTGTGECTITLSGLSDNGGPNVICTVEFSINNVTGITDPYTSALNSGFPVTIINPNYTNPTCP